MWWRITLFSSDKSHTRKLPTYRAYNLLQQSVAVSRNSVDNKRSIVSEYLSPNLGLNERVLTVSQLNAQVKKLLTNNFPLVVVEGEISGLTHHRASGHYYFNLKDERALLRCVMFSRSAARLAFQPEDGHKVLIRAEISLYERDGRYQAVIQHMEPHGEGELRLAMERLRAKLQELGWFEEEIKKPLPAFPKRVVIVSSSKGAATRDVFVNIWRRYPPVELTLQPTSVQGRLAVNEICQALATVNQLSVRPDLAILTRGGGSLEDLAAFNSEQVAAAIYQSEVPIVSAVGHDVDFTIADFVADLRAPTPSTAAELVTPDGRDLGIRFDEYALTLEKNLREAVTRHKTVVAHVSRRLRGPQREVVVNKQRLLERIHNFKRLQSELLARSDTRLAQLQRALNQAKPNVRLQHYRTKLNSAQSHICQLIASQNRENRARFTRTYEKLLQLDSQIRQNTSTRLLNLQRTLLRVRPQMTIKLRQTQIENAKSRLEVRVRENVQIAKSSAASVLRNLEAVSPLAVLTRGYAVVTKPKEGEYFGEITKSVNDLQLNDNIETHLSDGTVSSKITGIRKRNHGEKYQST